jgi:hypothetical protein
VCVCVCTMGEKGRLASGWSNDFVERDETFPFSFYFSRVFFC